METKTPSIFISHSSKDLTIARAVRNLLEDRGHHVLLLGLLQELHDEDIYALLEREIIAREWLVLIDSPNSQNSKWVQFEMKKARQYKKIVHLVSCKRFSASTRYEYEQALLKCINAFSRSLRVLLSHSRRDTQVALQLAIQLRNAGYEVWTLEAEVSAGDDWQKSIKQGIAKTLEQGVYIPILSQSAIKNTYLRYEIEYAVSQTDTFIIPVLLEDIWITQMPKSLVGFRYSELGPDINIKSVDDLLDILFRLRSWKNISECISV